MTKRHGDAPPEAGLSPESDENKNIALAVRQARDQLRAGTAPTAVLTHYLRLASEREQLAREKLRMEAEMLRAKTAALNAQARSEEMYLAAREAFGTYVSDATLEGVPDD